MEAPLKKAAIVVDHDMYSYFPHVRLWVADQQDNATLVLVVSDPARNNYYDDDSNTHTHTHTHTHTANWDLIIRNNNPARNRDIVFKEKAITILNDSGNLIPVVALDSDTSVLDMYRDHGVLVGLDEVGILNVA